MQGKVLAIFVTKDGMWDAAQMLPPLPEKYKKVFLDDSDSCRIYAQAGLGQFTSPTGEIVKGMLYKEE